MWKPSRRGTVCAATAGLMAGCVLLAPVRGAAETNGWSAYPGPRYGNELRQTPTASKPQSKLWWHDRAWWGLLYHPADATVRIAELMPDHTWRPTTAVVAGRPLSVGDALRDGAAVHVLNETAEGLVASSFAYDRSARRYTRQPGSSAVLGRRGSNAASLAKDSLGRLWVTFVSAGRVWVSHSDPARLRWTAPYVPAVPGRTVGNGEVSDIVAFDGQVGVLWSDQRSGAFRVALHADAAPDSRWTSETALVGRDMADDHISAHVVPHKGGSTIVAAVKTSRDENGGSADEPLVLVLRRDPAGTWSRHQVATVGDDVTRPSIAVDATNTVYVVGRRADSIVYKSAPLDDLTFAPGPGTRLMSNDEASFTDPTTTQQVVDARTGLVVLASDFLGHRYGHAEITVGGGSAAAASGAAVTITRPVAPSGLRGLVVDGAVRLVWAPSSADGLWAPAGRPATVRGYTVLRDGGPIAVTQGTSYVDSTPAGDRSHTYAVRARGLGGTRSASSAAVEVFVPAGADEAGLPIAYLLVAGFVALAALGGGGLAARIRRRDGEAVPLPRPRRPAVLRSSASTGRHARRR